MTGASAGVGRAVARALGDEGAKVGLIARTREALEDAAREIERAGGEALVLPLDVADAGAVEKAADEVVARWGRSGGAGDFDARAKGWSAELWFRMNRRSIAGAVVAVAACVIGYRAVTA